jgi:hypothetical protein
MVVLGLLSTNIAGSTKRSVASGWIFVCYCAGQISGPQFFKSTQAPAYRSGIVAMLCGFVLNLVLNQVLRLLYVLENKTRDRRLVGKSEGEILEMKRGSELQGFEDVTDRHNVSSGALCVRDTSSGLKHHRSCFDMLFSSNRKHIEKGNTLPGRTWCLILVPSDHFPPN